MREPVPELDCEAPPPVGGARACASEEHDEFAHVYGCVEIGVDGACPLVDDEVVGAALEECFDGCYWPDQRCGPDPARSDACCYWSVALECGNPGRPFVVRGCDRLAGVAARGDWSDDAVVDVDGMPSSWRDELARAWTEDARCEHAAVASFARFTLQLLALGAPAELVARAQRAGADELAHARAFFGLASAYAGAPIGPGPLVTSDALADGVDVEHVVIATVREGCIAETISLVQLATALANVRDPALRSVLATIVEEELEHVELAWAFVDWALAHGDAHLHAKVTAAFATAETAIPRSPAPEPAHAHAATWSAHGRLSAQARSDAAHATLREIVRPCAARLLAPRASACVVPADLDMG